MRLKKEKKPAPKKQPVKVEEDDDTASKDDDGVSISRNHANSQATKDNMSAAAAEPTVRSNAKDASVHQIGNGNPTGSSYVDTASIYDWKTFYDFLLKINSQNFSGNQSLSWGSIKL